MSEVQSAVCEALRQAKNLQDRGKLQLALSAAERVLHTVPTAGLAMAWEVVKRIATLSNRVSSQCPSEQAMEFLHKADSALVMYEKRLKGEARLASRPFFRLRNLTWNNIASWHRARRNLHMALHYLLKAFKLPQETEALFDCESLHAIAQTRLNISATYAEMGRHKEAVEHAEGALVALQQEMAQRQQRKRARKNGALLTLFVVAFYAIGVSEEALGHRAEAMEAYTNAVSIGQQLKATNRALFAARKALCDLKGSVEDAIFPPKPRFQREPHQIVSLPSSPCAPSTPTEPRIETRHRRMTAAAEQPVAVSRSGSHRSLKENPRKIARVQSASSLARSENHFPDDDKYYGGEELAKMARKRKEADRLNFVSSDQYFLSMITKQLNVTKDINHMRPLSASNAMGAWDKDEEEKRLVSALRLKRHPRSSRRESEHGLEVALKLIDRLKEEDLLKTKQSRVKVQSRMKTKAFRQALKDAVDRRDSAIGPTYPPQRLFFKAHGDNSPDRSTAGEEPKQASENYILAKKPALPPAREEIEKMMDELNDELKSMSGPLGKETKREAVRRTCDLAASTVHRRYTQTVAHKSQVEASATDVRRLASVVGRKKAAVKNALEAVVRSPTALFPY